MELFCLSRDTCFEYLCDGVRHSHSFPAAPETGSIPATHIYVTTGSNLGDFVRIDPEGRIKVVRRQAITNDPRFPPCYPKRPGARSVGIINGFSKAWGDQLIG